MLRYKVKGMLAGQVEAPISKSDLHRMIIAGALADCETRIKNCTLSDDIKATARVLEAAGAKVEFLPSGEIIVHPIQQVPTEHFTADCGESGSTLRFLMPVLAALGCRTTFVGQGNLPERPMLPMTEQLRINGVKVKGDTLPITISGQLQAGNYAFSGDVSSQFITGLLYALPLLDNSSVIEVTSPLQSSGYVDMTLEVLSRFGIHILQHDNRYYTKERQKYFSPEQLVAHGDWSSAAFWLCGAAIGDGPVTVHGVSYRSLQGDKRICDVLRRMGADIVIEENCVACCGSNLRGIEIDGSQIPDIIPILAVTACFAKGTTRITNAGRLRIKESDRIHAMAENLNKLGGKVTELEDGFIIEGQPYLKGGEVDSFGDHRIAMSMAVAAQRCQHSVIIQNPECVNKSYPGFYSDFQGLGGIVRVLELG